MEDSDFIRVLTERLAEREDIQETSRRRVVIDCSQLEEWYQGTDGEGLNPQDLALTSVDLAEFRTWLLRRCQASTAIRKFASIRAMLKLLAPAVLTSVRMPRIAVTKAPSPSGFTRKERLAIARGIAKLGVRDRAICTVALWTGVRASSIAAVKLSNVDVRPRSGSVTFDVLKGGVGRTITVPANAELREALAAWIRERPPVHHDFLFTGERYPYDPITRWTVHDVWHRRLARQLPKELAEKMRGPHQARHALARLLLDQGVPLPDVAAILGHSSVSTTADIYMRPSEADLRAHLDRAIGEEGDE